MKVNKDGKIIDMTELEKLEFKFWEEYYNLPECSNPDEFVLMTSEEQQAEMDASAAALHAIHVKYKTHLWMPSKMEKVNE